MLVDDRVLVDGTEFLRSTPPCAVATCYDWVSSEEGETSETGRSAELAFVQRDWS